MDTKEKDIVEVRTVRSDREANDHLSHGWILLSAGSSHIDSAGYQAKVHFILGRIKEVPKDDKA